MKRYIPQLIFIGTLSLLIGGCYTKLYRPGMEQAQRGPYDSLYERYDSTAIDTTLTAPEYTDTYPDYRYESRYDRWYYWGRPRTRWGFDFEGYDPGYYWSYYGYYDYYSVPWWNRWYHDPWWHGGGYPVGPGAPEEPRDRGRRELPPAGGGGSVLNPPPSYPNSPPPNPNPPPPDKDKKDEKKDDGKRGGRRGR